MRSAPIDIRDRPPYTVEQFCVKEEYEADLDRILVSEGEIESRIGCLAEEISRDYRERAENEVYLVCVLKGAMRFFDALTPRLELTVPNSEGVVRAARYSGGEPGAEQAEVRLLDREAIEGKDVLVVEDMIDEGYTLETILDRIEAAGPNSVEATVLFDKVARRQTDVDVAFTGFVIPDEFVVGYGIDYDERYRNLRHLAVLDETVRGT